VAAVAYVLDGIALGSSDFRFLAQAMAVVGATVFAADRLLADRLLRWWRRGRGPGGGGGPGPEEAEGGTKGDGGRAALLAVQLLWALFMGGRCLSIGLRIRSGSGGPMDVLG
jgi:hypothetical protein